MPGSVMAMARLNRPSIFIYGGTIKPGLKNRDIVSVFESVGALSSGKISNEEFLEVEKTSIPGPRGLWRYVYSKYNGFSNRGLRFKFGK